MNQISNAADEADLLREVAAAGPGYRGRRTHDSGPEFRSALADRLAQSGHPVPEFFRDGVEWIDRRAKLFEAGDYPDKGVSVSAEQLESIATGFDLPVPVWIEHAESPLELGYLTQVDASDGELFGTIALTKEANALVESSGAHALSIGLSPDLSEIREVSLVRSPRIPSAQLFASNVSFSGDLLQSDEARQWRRRFDELANAQRREKAQRSVDRLMADGRLVPAEAQFALALLAADDTVAYGEGRRPVAEIAAELFASRTPHRLFGELAPGSQPSLASLLLPEEAEFYQRHFPDVDLDVIAGAKSRRGTP